MSTTALIITIAIIFIAVVYGFRRDNVNILPGKNPGEILVFNSTGLIATIQNKKTILWHVHDLDSWTVSEVLDVAMDYDNLISKLNAER